MGRPYSFTHSRGAVQAPSIVSPDAAGVNPLYANQANSVTGTCAAGSAVTVTLTTAAGTTVAAASVAGAVWSASFTLTDADLGEATLVAVQSLAGGSLESAPRLTQVAELQAAGAAAGPFSETEHWVGATGTGPDMTNSRAIVFGWWSEDVAVTDQYLWGFNTATTGWFVFFGGAQDLYLFHRGASPGVRIIANTYKGYNSCAVMRGAGGGLRTSCNGGVGRAITSPGTYVPAGASGVHAIGYDASEALYPARDHSVLWVAVIDAVVDDAGLAAASGGSNGLHRWQPPAYVSGHANLRWLWRAQDWDGSSSTFAGSGSSPYTMTRVGAGGSKRVFPAYKRYSIPTGAVWDSAGAFSQGTTGQTGLRRSLYAQTRFRTDAVDLAADGPAAVAVDNLVSTWNAVAWPAQIESGVNVDGVPQQANHNGLVPYPGVLQTEGYGLQRGMDSPGITAPGEKEVALVDGFQTTVGASFGSAGTALKVRVPATATFDWVRRAAPEKQIVCMHDSLGEQIEGLPLTPGTDNPTSKSWPILMRQNAAAAGYRVACDGWGSATLYQRISSAPLRAATLATLQGLAVGTLENIFLIPLGTNDWGLPSAYASAAAIQADVTTFSQDLLAAGIPGTIIYWIGPTSRLNESVNNANGYNVPAVRTALTNGAAAVGDARVRSASAAAWVSLANRTDSAQLHWNLAGMAQFEAAARALLAVY